MTPVATRFGDLLAEPLRNGVYKPKQYHGYGAKVINMKELFAYDRIDDQGTDRVYLEPDEFERFRVAPGDLLFARRSFVLEGAGRCSIVRNPIEDTTFESSMIRARLDREKALPEFIYYLFASVIGRSAMAGIATRTAVSGITGRSLQELAIPVPSIATQQKVVSVLSSYDDLIENNNRRIRILEEMAQRIYREWFVDFRYPGHKDVPLVDSESGQIPEGWNVSPVGSTIQVLGGGTPSKAVTEYWEPGTITWFTPTDLTRASAMFVSRSALMISEQGLAKSSAKLFLPGAVMMTSRATIGVIAINTVPAATNQGFITCVPTESVGAYHLYFWLHDKRELITSLASGATFKEINKKTFRSIPFVKAPHDIERQFEERLEPIALQLQTLLVMQSTLRETRDLLLPRLIAGALDVSDLRISVPELVA